MGFKLSWNARVADFQTANIEKYVCCETMHL